MIQTQELGGYSNYAFAPETFPESRPVLPTLHPVPDNIPPTTTLSMPLNYSESIFDANLINQYYEDSISTAALLPSILGNVSANTSNRRFCGTPSTLPVGERASLFESSSSEPLSPDTTTSGSYFISSTASTDLTTNSGSMTSSVDSSASRLVEKIAARRARFNETAARDVIPEELDRQDLERPRKKSAEERQRAPDSSDESEPEAPSFEQPPERRHPRCDLPRHASAAQKQYGDIARLSQLARIARVNLRITNEDEDEKLL